MAVLRRLVVVAIAVVACGVTGCDLAPRYHACAIACGAGDTCPQGQFCSDDQFCHSETEFPTVSCVADAGVDATTVDASPPDVPIADGAPAEVDATPPDASSSCDLGTATNAAAVSDPQRFGDVVAFAGGAALPPGAYRIEYVDGCSRYAPGLWWSIHGRLDGDVSWWLVGGSKSTRLRLLPGTEGMLPGTAGAGERNGFELFDQCVTSNQLVAPIEFDHAGGPLGIHQADIYYGDNVSGEDGRNPMWRLVRLTPCPDAVPYELPDRQ